MNNIATPSGTDLRANDHHRRLTLVSAVVVCIGALCWSGCRDEAQERFPVTGQVLIDGRPLSSGSIRFVPQHGRPVSSALDEAGRFRLASQAVGDHVEEGVAPGLYRVAVTSNRIVAEETAIWNAPPKYTDFRTSGLEVVVDRPLHALTIDLSWEGQERVDAPDAPASSSTAQPESVASGEPSKGATSTDTEVED